MKDANRVVNYRRRATCLLRLFSIPFLESGGHVGATRVTAFQCSNRWSRRSASSRSHAIRLQVVKPAMGHSNPWYGAPDPYVSAGTSIAPTAQALNDMGIVVVPGKGGVAATTATMASWPEMAQKAVADGVPVLDQSALTQTAVLPGFAPTGSWLPLHNPMVPLETPATFAAQVEWAASFLNVVDKLPLAVFCYALVEFFVLRPNLDLYKEDIETNPGPVWADTVAVSSVRLVMFTIVAAVTTTVFG